MNDIGLKADISARYKPFLDKVLENHPDVFGRLFALLAGVTQADYYEIPEAEKAVPKVKF